SRVGPMAWGSQGEVFLGEDLVHTRDYSDETARIIDEEVERILREQEERCRETLRANRKGLDLVARALLEHETIDGEEVKRLIALGRDGEGTDGATGDGAAVAASSGANGGDERDPETEDAAAPADQAYASVSPPPPPQRPPAPPT